MTARLVRHRKKLAARGARRVEVVVPSADAGFVRDVAALLRGGGERAERVRAELRPLVGHGRAKSGAELVAFFRASPLVGVEMSFERDKSPGRRVEIGR